MITDENKIQIIQHLEEIAKLIKWPCWANGLSILLTEDGYNPGQNPWQNPWIPRPPRTIREMTREEKIHALQSYFQTPICKFFDRAEDSLIDQMCINARIKTEVLA